MDVASPRCSLPHVSRITTTTTTTRRRTTNDFSNMRAAIFQRSCGTKILSRQVVAGSITHFMIRQQKQVSATAVLPTQNPKLKLFFCAMKCVILIRPVLEPDFAWQNILTTHWLLNNSRLKKYLFTNPKP